MSFSNSISKSEAALIEALTLDESTQKSTTNPSPLPPSSAAAFASTKVVEKYLFACELYFSTLKLAESSSSHTSEVPKLKSRVVEILDRVEQLKGLKGKIVSGGKGGKNGGGDGGDGKVKSVGNTHVPSSSASASVSAVCNKNLLSSSLSPSPSPSVPKQTINKNEPVSNLTAEEVDVLKRSSKIGPKIFLPFLASDIHPQQFQTLGDLPYTDPDGPITLNPSQQKHFYKYARPSEILANSRGGRMKDVVMYNTLSPYSIKQTLVSDCSFIASLCIASAYELRFNERIITSIIYPQNKQGKPIVNSNGKYIIKLHLNGLPRLVIVDDYLPVDHSYNLLCSHTSCSSHLELWVSLIEKAYMKVNGGGSYAFPGSNSGVDLFCLTGWLPERVFFGEDDRGKGNGNGIGKPDGGGGRKKLKEHETSTERVFDRMNSAMAYGDCLITASLGTEYTDDAADALGLVTKHAYAVLNVKVTADGRRFIMMKNPWARQCWTGRFSASDDRNWNPKLCRELGYDNVKARDKDDGVFYIIWEDFVCYFRCLYINWSTGLFKYKYVTHGLWPASQGPKSDLYCCEDNPQYVLKLSREAVRKKSTVFILISRHVDLDEQNGKESEDFLSCNIYKSGDDDGDGGNGDGKLARTVYPSQNCLRRGIHTSNPHVLLRHDATTDSSLNLVLSQYIKKSDVTYTLSCHCMEMFSFSHAPALLKNKVALTGSWRDGNAGGRSSSYHINPQFIITVNSNSDNGSASATIELMLKANPKLSINLTLVEALGRERIDSLPSKEHEIMTTGDYRNGVAYCTRNLKNGTYICIVSTWEYGEVGAYVLEVRTDLKVNCKNADVSIVEVKPEGEDMYVYILDDEWLGVNAAGCGNYGRYLENPMYILSLKDGSVSGGGGGEGCIVYGRFSVDQTGSERIPMNASAYTSIDSHTGKINSNASPVGKTCGLLSTTTEGVYSTSHTCLLPKFSLPVKNNNGGVVTVVVSTFEPREVGFKLTVFCGRELVVRRVN